MNRFCVASSVRALAASAMFAVAAICQAAPVSWLIQGTVTQASVVSLPGFIDVGDSFSVVLHFDTSTPVSNPVACGSGGIGTLCRHNGGLAQYFSNLVIDGQTLGDFNPVPAGNNQIIVRNNRPPPEDPDSAVRVDGYSFVTTDDARPGFMGVIFRGPEDLDLVTDGRVLPASPPAGLTDLSISVFEYCDDLVEGECGRFVSGLITSVVAVPEPGTLALLGLGLAGLAAVRRRKQ